MDALCGDNSVSCVGPQGECWGGREQNSEMEITFPAIDLNHPEMHLYSE